MSAGYPSNDRIITEPIPAAQHDPAWSVAAYQSLARDARGPLIQSAGYVDWLPARRPDPDATTVDLTAAPASTKKPPTTRRRIGVVVGAGLVLAVIGAALWWTTGHDDEAPTGAVTVSPSPASPPVVADWCEPARDGARVRGNSRGSTSSATEAIFALEYAYYVLRDATTIRALLAPDGRFGTDAEIQNGIDTVPLGTTHCVEAAPAGPDRWTVTLTERRPGGRTLTHHQTITTRQHDRRVLIVSVETA